MSPKAKSNNAETMEEVARRVATAVWQEDATLQRLAALIKDSVIAELQAVIENNTAVIAKLQNSLEERDKKISQLESQLIKKTDELEQYQRRQCLRIFGVPEEAGEDTDKIAMNVAEKIGVKLVLSDIDRSHRVGVKKDKPRPVIVKFTSYRKRSEVFRSKKLLKNTGVTIREDLSQIRYKLLQQCISKYGLVNVWTIDGIIMVNTGQNKIRVTCEEDISRH